MESLSAGTGSMERPKAIFVNRFFYPDESATSQILTDVCFHLGGKGWDVHVVASNRRLGDPSSRLDARETVNGVEVARVRTTNIGSGSMLGRMIDYLSFYPTAFWKLLRLCRRGDVVIVKTDPPLISIAAAAAARLRGAKLVNWLQDLYPEVAIELGVGAVRGPLGRLLTRLRNGVLRNADANIVIGARMGDRLRGFGVSEDRIHLLPNWSDDELVKPMPARESRVRRAWGLGDDLFVFGYSGNLGRAHEAETILGAAKLLKHRSDICFLFVGSGHESQKLQAELAASGLSNFLFKGQQARSDLADSLAAADAHWLSLRPELEGLIVPSKFYGIAAAGRPVVAVTACDGEIAQLVRTFGCGHVVEPGDSPGLAAAIEKLADDPQERLEMGRRARLAIDREFSRSLTLSGWETLFERLLGASGKLEDQQTGARPCRLTP